MSLRTEPQTAVERLYPEVYELLHPGDCYLISHNHERMLVACNRDGKIVFEYVSMRPGQNS